MEETNIQPEKKSSFIRYIIIGVLVIAASCFCFIRSCNDKKVIKQIKEQHKIIDQNNTKITVIDNKTKDIDKSIQNNNTKLSKIKVIKKEDIENEFKKTNLDDLSRAFTELGYPNSVIRK